MQLGLEREDPVAVDDLDLRHAVGGPAGVERVHRLHFFVGEGGHQNADAAEGETQVRLELVEHRVAADFEARLEGGGVVVETGMNNAGVGFGHAEGDVGPAFHQYG